MSKTLVVVLGVTLGLAAFMGHAEAVCQDKLGSGQWKSFSSCMDYRTPVTLRPVSTYAWVKITNADGQEVFSQAVDRTTNITVESKGSFTIKSLNGDVIVTSGPCGPIDTPCGL